MVNPIARGTDDRSVGRNSEEFLREWCWDKNQQARQVHWAHWLYVSHDKDTGIVTTRSRTGSDALDVIKVLNGWYPDFMNWDEDRLDSEFRIIRFMARMGMPQSEYDRRQTKIARPKLALPSG
jgi:hypothetical protein